jgi:hypothetical protein
MPEQLQDRNAGADGVREVVIEDAARLWAGATDAVPITTFEM